MTDKAVIEMDTSVVASTEHISCMLADEVVLLSLETGQYYGLNPVASSVWQLIQEPRSVADVCHGLMSEYEGVTLEECATEVLALLKELASLEIVRILPG